MNSVSRENHTFVRVRAIILTAFLLTTGSLCYPVNEDTTQKQDHIPTTSSYHSIIKPDDVITKWSPDTKTTTVMTAPSLTSTLSVERNPTNFDWTTSIGRFQTTKALASGTKVCFRVRILRMLFRLMLLKASGFNIQQLKAAAGTRDSVVEEREFSITDDELAEICKELCGLGSCPPGCPGDYQPPWGRK